jgi:hypothetical protein
MRILIASSLFIVLIALSASAVLGCSCMAKPTVLDSFEGSELTVVARLASVEKTREKKDEDDIHYIRSATMVVIKVFKGDVKPGQELKFAQGGGADCVWTFDEDWIGEDFLFYLGRPTKGHPFIDDEEEDEEEGEGDQKIDKARSGELMYRAGTCGRSRSIENARDDLSYLENVEKYRGRTRLSGRFGAWWFNDDFRGADIKLKIVGKSKSYSAKTDKDGYFELYDLLPGEYVVTVASPFGWKTNDYMVEHTSTGYEGFDPRAKPKAKNQIPIMIKKGRHTALDLTFDIDTAIKGKVLSPAGKPMKGVGVMAVSTERKEGDYRGPSDYTDEKGEFVIEEMAPGNYILVVNADGRKDADEPFGVLFYPGVTEFSNAAVIAVEAGKYVTGRIIQIPQSVELVPIKGMFLFSDGKPVVDEWVKFAPDDQGLYDEMRQETDVTGSFFFQVPKGVKGTISGEMYMYIGAFKNCEKLDALIKESGSNNFLTVRSSILQVDTSEPPVSVEITFPFPSCEKATKD